MFGVFVEGQLKNKDIYIIIGYNRGVLDEKEIYYTIFCVGLQHII